MPSLRFHLLDFNLTEDDLGLDKSTYPKLLGLEGAKQKAQELYQTALHELDNLPFDTTALRALAEFIVNRKS